MDSGTFPDTTRISHHRADSSSEGLSLEAYNVGERDRSNSSMFNRETLPYHHEFPHALICDGQISLQQLHSLSFFLTNTCDIEAIQVG